MAMGWVMLTAGCSKASADGTGKGVATERASAPAGAGAKAYSSKGIIKSFGPEKKYTSIAHEEIPGYMNAMTMAFEAGEPNQLDPFVAGDRVSFSFRSEEDGRQVLTSIRKEP